MVYPCESHGSRPVVIFFMLKERVIAFIDGFNLYHAIDALKQPHLKWVDLWKLSSLFIKCKSQELSGVFYFSSYAEWKPQSKLRHLQYVKALKIAGVTPVMGKFKKKDRKCPSCKYQWFGYEEKQTDVNIALTLLNLAYQNQYDRAFLISNDSDLVPAIQMVRTNFSDKYVTSIVPPHYKHSNELKNVSSDKAKITIANLERCLMPERIYSSDSQLMAIRPEEYSPEVRIFS